MRLRHLGQMDTRRARESRPKADNSRVMIIVWKVLTFLVCRIEICFKSNFYNPSIFAGLKCIYTHTYIPSIESRTIVGNSCQLCEKRKCSSHSGKYFHLWRVIWKKSNSKPGLYLYLYFQKMKYSNLFLYSTEYYIYTPYS